MGKKPEEKRPEEKKPDKSGKFDKFGKKKPVDEKIKPLDKKKEESKPDDKTKGVQPEEVVVVEQQEVQEENEDFLLALEKIEPVEKKPEEKKPEEKKPDKPGKVDKFGKEKPVDEKIKPL